MSYNTPNRAKQARVLFSLRLLGITTADFYGAYPDTVIDEALQGRHDQLALVQYKK